jgi:putative ABC transport system substrate-binding protein
VQLYTVWSIVALVLSVFAAPLVARAQPQGKIPLVAWLRPGYPPDPSHPNDASALYLSAFRQGLRDLGYVEGQNIRLEYRYAAYQWDRLPALAAELVQLKPEVLVTNTDQAVVAAKQATTTIPIVVAVADDLVALGIVASLARPGGNVTGQILRDHELAGKRLEMLKEAAPTITQVAILTDPTGPGSAHVPSAFEREAHALGVRLQRVDAGTPEAISDALATIVQSEANALMIQDSAMFNAHRQHILDVAQTHRLPTVCGVRVYAEAGCLIAYAPNLLEMFRRTAGFVDKILKGTKPADIPMELPPKLELVLNLKTAEGLGITFPQRLLVLADEVMK